MVEKKMIATIDENNNCVSPINCVSETDGCELAISGVRNCDK